MYTSITGWLSQLANWYSNASSGEIFWLALGFTGQIVFGLRFVVQWIVSEKAGRSVIPVIFWYLSITGSLMLFVYATYRLDPVFMLGQGTGCFIYIRNLVLIKKSKQLET